MPENTIHIEWSGFGALVADHEAHHKNGVVVTGAPCEATALSPCGVVLVHPRSGATLTLDAVVVGPCADGTRLALRGFNDELAETLRRFLFDELPARAAPSSPSPPTDHPSHAPTQSALGDDQGLLDDDQGLLNDDQGLLDDDQGLLDADDAQDEASVARRTSVHEQVRALAPAERRRLAATGGITERTALERAFGKDVWDALLSNPRLTLPEVARIARMGALPVPLVERIVAQTAWITSAQVRRALLSNPRLRGPSLQKVLAAAPRSELKLMPQQTSYPQHVREAARKMHGP